MKFISKEEFLEQPKEVQDKIKELWNPEFGDLFMYNFDFSTLIQIVYDHKNNMICTQGVKSLWQDKREVIPLLTMDKIIEMIERVTGLRLEIAYDFVTGDLELILFEDPMGYNIVLNNNKFKCEDRLHLLWNALTEIIKENL